jgi:hypothetical protein
MSASVAVVVEEKDCGDVWGSMEAVEGKEQDESRVAKKGQEQTRRARRELALARPKRADDEPIHIKRSALPRRSQITSL